MSIKLNPPAGRRPPIMITIAGEAGSGKSSVAAFIAFALEEIGVTDVIVHDIEVRTEADLWSKRDNVVSSPNILGEVTITTIPTVRNGPTQ